MPWHIERNSSRCPASKPFAVIKDDDGALEGCHASEAAAKAQMAALYASERSDGMQIEFRNIDPESAEWRFTNGPDADGTFAGYLNVFDATDTYGTRFRPGAWISGGLEVSRTYPLLDMHDASSIHSVLGGFRAKEDEKGLYIEGQFAATTAGQEARTVAGMGFAPELSVGFVRLATQDDDPTAIISARLIEGSLIIKGMASTPGAELVSVRCADVSLRRRRAAARLRLLV